MNVNKQTPMQEAIEKNRKSIKTLQEIENRTEFEKGMLAYAHAFEEDLKQLLPKEQQVTEDAFNVGLEQGNNNTFTNNVEDTYFYNGKNYYNSKFK